MYVYVCELNVDENRKWGGGWGGAVCEWMCGGSEWMFVWVSE